MGDKWAMVGGASHCFLGDEPTFRQTGCTNFYEFGCGKAGKHVIPYLLEQGHQVLNVDLIPLYYADVDNLTVGTYNVIEAAVPCHNFANTIE